MGPGPYGGICLVSLGNGPKPCLSPPDLFEYKFIDSRIINSTFLHYKEGCQLDFSDDNNAYMIYFVSFLGTLAVLPGNIVSALLMDKIGRLRMLGEGTPFWQVLGRDQPPISAGRPGRRGVEAAREMWVAPFQPWDWLSRGRFRIWCGAGPLLSSALL